MMNLVERLRLSFNVQCQSTIDLNNEAADRIEELELERDNALRLAKQCTDRGMEVERQMAELKANYKSVSQATHTAFTEKIEELESVLRQAKETLMHYQYGGSSYKKPADAAIAKIEDVLHDKH